MDDPKPVLVRFPNGFEEMGIAVSEDTVEVGPIGLYVELYDVIVLDGTPREVTGIHQQMHTALGLGRPESEGGEMATRLKHRPAR